MQDSQPQALAGAVSGFRMLADGSISVTLVFEPKDRAAAMALMGSPGQPVAVAALAAGFAQAQDKPPRDQRGPLCREACELCANPGFHTFIARLGWDRNEESAKAYILAACGVASRKELDTDANAAEAYRRRVRGEFLRWMREQQDQPA